MKQSNASTNQFNLGNILVEFAQSIDDSHTGCKHHWLEFIASSLDGTSSIFFDLQFTGSSRTKVVLRGQGLSALLGDVLKKYCVAKDTYTDVPILAFLTLDSHMLINSYGFDEC